MTFVTTLTFESGDRPALEGTVGEIKRLLERKGVECKGPHAAPPETVRVPQYRDLLPGAEFPAWEYTVYSRRIEIHGSEAVAREVAGREFPDALHVEIDVDRKRPLGYRDR